MKICLVRGHVIESPHQRAIVPVQATAEIRDQQASVQAKHTGGPWTVLSRRDGLSQLDRLVCFLQVMLFGDNLSVLKAWLSGLHGDFSNGEGIRASLEELSQY